jgi:hypothetical protein
MSESIPATCEKCGMRAAEVKQAEDVKVPIEKGKPLKRGMYLCDACWFRTKPSGNWKK